MSKRKLLCNGSKLAFCVLLITGTSDKAKAEKSPIDLGVNAKAENVISADEKAIDSAINYKEAQDQLAKKEQGDSLEAERQKVKDFFYKTLFEYLRQETEFDDEELSNKLRNKLAPYFAKSSRVGVKFSGGNTYYFPENLFKSRYSEAARLHHPIDITKNDLSFTFEKGSDKVEYLVIDLRRDY